MRSTPSLRAAASIIDPKSRSEILSHYQRMRAVVMRLNNTLVKHLSKDMIEEGGRKLGILKRGTLVFDSEEQTSVLMDYCIYNVRRNGRNTVERFLVESPTQEDTDEMAGLRAMQNARYALVVVESVEPGLGIYVHDLSTDEHLLITDLGLGESAPPGLILASRLLFFEGFAMTSGASIPIGMLPEGREKETTEVLPRLLNPDENGEVDPADLIHTCLTRSTPPNMHYQSPKLGKQGVAATASIPASARVGRNDLCPCGSGKKFKRCCMKKSQ